MKFLNVAYNHKWFSVSYLDEQGITQTINLDHSLNSGVEMFLLEQVELQKAINEAYNLRIEEEKKFKEEERKQLLERRNLEESLKRGEAEKLKSLEQLEKQKKQEIQKKLDLEATKKRFEEKKRQEEERIRIHHEEMERLKAESDNKVKEEDRLVNKSLLEFEASERIKRELP